MGGSHYLKRFGERKEGPPPRLDFDQEMRLHEALRALIYGDLLHSAHDCAEGGLAVALAECCLSRPLLEAQAPASLGAEINLPASPTPSRPELILFNESQSRAIVSLDPAREADFLHLTSSCGVPTLLLGTVTEAPVLKLAMENQPGWQWPLAQLEEAWGGTIDQIMA
jgi:phosphoribosylformylglycinamidine synthase